MTAVEELTQAKAFELYTCTKSYININLYEKLGYRIYKEEQGGKDLSFAYMRKEIMKQAITINIYYSGSSGSARAFAKEMIVSGIVDRIRAKEGNLRYEYFFPMDDPETVLLIDQWKDQAAIDEHHRSDLMPMIAELRDKYDLHMRVERFVSDGSSQSLDKDFIRE